MLSSSIAKSFATKSLRGLAFRSLSTSPHRIQEQVIAPNRVPLSDRTSTSAQVESTSTSPFCVLRTNADTNQVYMLPTKTAPSYDIRESPVDFEMTLFLSKESPVHHLAVDVDQDAKALRITGDEADATGKFFSKRFAFGGLLDVDRLSTEVTYDHITIRGPKIHYLNGNTRFNHVM